MATVNVKNCLGCGADHVGLERMIDPDTLKPYVICPENHTIFLYTEPIQTEPVQGVLQDKPVSKCIPLADLQLIKEHLWESFDPRVKYNADPLKMANSTIIRMRSEIKFVLGKLGECVPELRDVIENEISQGDLKWNP